MNTNPSSPRSTTGNRRIQRTAAGLAALVLGAVLPSCSFLKPAQSTTRHYFLTPIAATNAAQAGVVAVGIGPVKLPAYLFNTALAIRRGTNEVEYLSAANWAERLDAGFQRVLAANLAALLPTDRVYLSAWQKADVNAEIHVVIEAFDVDAFGRGQLVARWRIVSPGGDQVIRAGTSRLTRTGVSPDNDAGGTVATMSELLGDFSRQVTQVLQETNLPPRNSPEARR